MHQMNGRAEHFNRTLNEKAQAMCQQAGLPDSWWEFCVLHANYVYNHTPVCHLEWKTPNELVFKEKPDVSHLRILGCRAYVFILREVQKNKLSPKSELMIFLGYRDHHSNMIFMRSPNNIIFTAATALFDENLFPKCVKHTIPPVTQLQDNQLEEPVVEIELGNNSDEENVPAPPPFFTLPSDEDRSHDNADHQHLPQPRLPPATPGGTGSAPPRRSGHLRNMPSKEGNIYPPGMSTDTDLCKKLPKAGTLGSAPDFSDESSNTLDDDLAIAKMAVEGGVSWYNYLLSKAIPHHDEFPDPMYVRDWTRKDIGRLPADEQQAWRQAQFEELEALKKQNIYEFADLPPG